jgi:hypothetical protein
MKDKAIIKFLETIENPVQKDYCESILRIWESQTEDWYDYNNFIIALMLLLKFCYLQFSLFTKTIFEKEAENRKDIRKTINRIFV